MATTTNLNSLVINYLTQAQYDEAAANNTLNENQLYLTPTGITAADISRWNSKSDTDEKVKAIALPTTSATYYLVLGSNSGNAETKNYSNKLTFNYDSDQVVLKVGDTTNGQKGRIYLYGSSAAGVTYLDTTATVSRAITLPDASGTIALTSDINDQIFIATYNTTSYSDVLAAYNAGKIIICKEVFSQANTYYGYLEKYENNTAFYFASPLDINSSGDKLTVVYTLNSNNTWSTDNIGMESSSTQLIRWTEV